MTSTNPYRVGYIFTKKKLSRSGMQNFDIYAKKYNIDIFMIDLDIPLEKQGPFDCIIHKLTDLIAQADGGDEIAIKQVKNVKDYIAEHPEIPIFDPLNVVCKLMDRITANDLLNSVIKQKKESGEKCLFNLPESSIKPLITEQLKNTKFPIMCKRIGACSTKISHEMALIPSLDKIDEAKKIMSSGNPDIENEEYILQQFINHDGILFKIYVFDGNFRIVVRPSLNNVKSSDIIFFDSQRIPKEFKETKASGEGVPPPDSFSNMMKDESEKQKKIDLINYDYIKEITKDLSERLELTLFGYDVVIDSETNQYYIVDVNYFPAYDGVENFQEVLAKAILKKIQKNKN